MPDINFPSSSGTHLAQHKDNQVFLEQLQEKAEILKPGDMVSAEDYKAVVQHLVWHHGRFAKVLEISDKYQEILTSYTEKPIVAESSLKEAGSSDLDPVSESLIENLRTSTDPDVVALVKRHKKVISRMKKILAISDNYQNLLRDASIKLELLAKTDPLTKLSNRFDMIGHLEIQGVRMARSGTRYSVMFFDVDFFKEVNDTHGHDIGDRVLVVLADYFRQTLRRTDYCGRWGGEEFLIVCPDTEMDQALLAAEKIRKGVSALRIETAVGPLTITLSGGVAEPNDRDEDWEQVVNRADQGLYLAKDQGRNKVVAV